jgi:hypothetical protein
MALRIELWMETGLADGFEQWWDDVDGWLDSEDGLRTRFPIMASIDPYAFAVIPRNDFPALISELADIAALAPAPVSAIAVHLAHVCERGLVAGSAELRLVGD